ncbi:hypothetical protein ILUMI_04796 [Ignelater luminosus]|uniref:Uncharacterized protein n=1 Tax=Ignelater luminosus TaxID=2038154 RepID=A0A8K0D8A0_IGNLU|nr:hypothetical protein ILUMI_04796 [Ignelater luminosus]
MNRKYITSDIFSVREPQSRDHEQIYSIGGTPSGKRNRLRATSSNVFPVGCMGTKPPPIEEALVENKMDEDILEEDKPKIGSPRIQMEAGDNDQPTDIPSPKPIAAPPKRNILTGEGVESTDMPRSTMYRKRSEKTKFLY